MSKDNTLPAEQGSTKPRKGRASGLKAAAAREKAQEQPQHFNVTSRDYDVGLIEDFLDRVFHTEDFGEEEEVLLWAVPRHSKPVYPMGEDEMLDMLESTRVGKALYFGTATARRDHTGNLYNRQSLFERLHVVVLDDIGTKARAEDLPEAMQNPTYIIESSPGNFQYGYVLETPLDNLEEAKALVMLMYEAGIADAGGKMPNKLVRLPEGINGKKDRNKCDFVTKLHTMDGPYWTPQGLLDALNAGVEWDEVLKDAAEATKRRMRLKGGSTPWAPYKPARASMSGIIDPVLEWLEDQDMIITETGDWVTIPCPFKHQHTSGGDTAGYKPLGVGDDPSQRGFHCFHDGCAEMKTRDFLEFVGLMDGPNASVRDEVAELVSNYVFDMSSDCAWKIKDVPAPMPVSMSAMQHTFPRGTLVYGSDGKPKTVSEYKRWLVSESRVTVMGPTFDPSNPARLVSRGDDLYVNQFAPPDWGEGSYEVEHVQKFKEFVKYLIPDGFEREYFFDWLAAKCQNMGFRGAAIVMVAQRQGIGRSTLANMIETLLGPVNCRNEPFEKIVGEAQFNEWLEAPFVVSDETLNTGTLNQYKTYEKLKEIIDPRPKVVTINPKYGRQRRTTIHSSFLFLSNHSNALAMSADDRRFFVISNPHTPADPKYFMELNDWLEDEAWARSVFRWLMSFKPDMERLLAPPEVTAGKEAMIEENRGAIQTVGEEILKAWPCEYISAKQFENAVESFAHRIDLYDMPKYKTQISKVFTSMTYPVHKNSTVRISDRSERVRVIVNRANDDTAVKGGTVPEKERKRIALASIQDNVKGALKAVSEALDEVGL